MAWSAGWMICAFSVSPRQATGSTSRNRRTSTRRCCSSFAEQPGAMCYNSWGTHEDASFITCQDSISMIRTVNVTRYVTPLREGGSLPAIVEADDDGLYVLKFRGAGQGPLALIAELVAGEIGRLLGLPVPEIVFAQLDGAIGRNEPDFEIKDLIQASVGLNLGLAFLPGSLPFDPATSPR